MRTIRIGPGEHLVTQRADEQIVTVLGSCVAACIRDPVAGVGGMNHFMLPESETGVWGEASANMRYGNFAMERLINDILCRGGQRGRLEIKLFGGATLVTNGASVGRQNADFVEAYMAAEGMPVAASHLRGTHARRIEFVPLSGRVRMLEMSDETAPIALPERSFLKAIQGTDNSSAIELFD